MSVIVKILMINKFLYPNGGSESYIFKLGDALKFTDELRKMAGDNVIFTGFVSGRLHEELYSNSYVYVLPSNLEGMPLSLLEAMSYGNCCVVSDIEECAEVVEDKAVVFRKSDVKALRASLQTLCDNEELVNGYKQTATAFICDKYSWDDVAKKTLDIYIRSNN